MQVEVWHHFGMDQRSFLAPSVWWLSGSCMHWHTPPCFMTPTSVKPKIAQSSPNHPSNCQHGPNCHKVVLNRKYCFENVFPCQKLSETQVTIMCTGTCVIFDDNLLLLSDTIPFLASLCSFSIEINSVVEQKVLLDNNFPWSWQCKLSPKTTF